MKTINGSLYQWEQKEKKKEKRRQIYAKRLEGLFIVSNIPPWLLLKMAGYKPMKKTHWIFPLDEKTRFHAVIDNYTIHLHHDTSRGKGKKHIAMPYGVHPELNRIAKMMPPTPSTE